MRVGLFTNNYLPFRGGVTTAVETLREGIVARGGGAWVFAPAPVAPTSDPPFVFRYPSIPAPTYPGFALPVPFSPRLGRLARRLDLDVFHAQHPFLLGVTARRLARRLGRPLVFTYHTRYDKYAHYVPLPEPAAAALALRLASRFADSADLVVVPSASVAHLLRGRGVRKPVVVIPTGVALDRFSPGDRAEARRSLGLSPDDPVCLYVGRLDREKSVDVVLRAFTGIAGAIPHVRLVLVGQGSHHAHLRKLAAAGPAADRVHFAGGMPHEALPAFYRAADVFLFASQTETQGLVLAEAHACALPAVAVRAPGVDEVVEDGLTGRLTKPDPRELADAAVALLLDDEQRQALGRAARAIVAARFSGQVQIDLLLAQYARLVER